jgi:hypothetical protein
MALKHENREPAAAVILWIVAVLTITGGIGFALDAARGVGVGSFGVALAIGIAAGAAISGLTLIAFATVIFDLRSAAIDLAALRDKLAPKE